MRPTTPFRRIARVWDYLLGNGPAEPQKHRSRLGVEALEGRDVPSTVTVERMSDAGEAGFAGGPGSAGFFRFTRDGDISQDLVVTYTVGGTATDGGDYTSLGGTTVSVLFLADESTADVAVEGLEDLEYDPGETVSVTIEEGPDYTVGSQGYAELAIVESAAATFTVNSTDGVVWYTLPWDLVDENEPTQSLALTNFRLLFGGQYFDEGSADFSAQPPTAEFADGVLVNIKFTAVLPGVVGGVNKLVADGGSVTAYDPGDDQVGAPAGLQKKAQLAPKKAENSINPATGRPFGATVKVTIAFSGLPAAAGNKVEYTVLDATTGKPFPGPNAPPITQGFTFQGVVTDAAALPYDITAPVGARVNIQVTIRDAAGNALATETLNSNFLVP